MLVLKIIVGLIVLAGIIWSFFAFNNHCKNKFDYRFFTMPSFLTVGASLIATSFGNEWRMNSIQTNGDILNGIVIMGIGVIVALFLVYLNLKNTNLIYGLGGSAVQLVVFGVLAYFGLLILMLGIFISVLASMGARPVYVVNKQSKASLLLQKARK